MLPDRVSNRGPLTYESGALLEKMREAFAMHKILMYMRYQCLNFNETLTLLLVFLPTLEQPGPDCVIFMALSLKLGILNRTHWEVYMTFFQM